MDNVTHTLTGLMLARAGLNRLGPQATAALLISSNLPDGDIVYSLGGQLAYLHCHRHWTHGLPMAPVMAGITIGILWLWCRFTRFSQPWRSASWWGAYAAALIGTIGHILFDATNAYAVRLALPFNAEWYSVNAFFIFDPVVLAALLLAVSAPAISGLVASEIGSRRGTGRGWALFALAVIAGYGSFRLMQHHRALEVLDSHVYPQGVVQRVEAFPTAFSPFKWLAFVETDQAWTVYDLDLNRPFDPGAGTVSYKPKSDPALNKTWESEEGRIYRDFARYAAWRVTPLAEPEGGTLVEANDLRFGAPGSKAFSLSIKYDRQLNEVDQRFVYGVSGPR